MTPFYFLALTEEEKRLMVAAGVMSYPEPTPPRVHPTGAIRGQVLGSKVRTILGMRPGEYIEAADWSEAKSWGSTARHNGLRTSVIRIPGTPRYTVTLIGPYAQVGYARAGRSAA